MIKTCHQKISVSKQALEGGNEGVWAKLEEVGGLCRQLLREGLLGPVASKRPV